MANHLAYTHLYMFIVAEDMGNKEKTITNALLIVSVLWMIPLYLAIPEATAEIWADAVIWIGTMTVEYIIAYFCWLRPALQNVE